MELRNCARCGKLFLYQGIPYCTECQKLDEEDFAKVKDYLYEHPGAPLIEVSDATQVPPDRILRYLKEGRLELASEQNSILKCERCGAPIRMGRYCEKCIVEVSEGLRKGLQSNPDKSINSRDRLYIEDRIKERRRYY